MTNTQRKRPRIESLHALDTWTPLGSLMVSWHRLMNGDRQPYVNANIWRLPEEKPYSAEQLMHAMSSQQKALIPFRINDHRQNCLVLRATIAFAAPVDEIRTEWILGLDGILERGAHDKETEAERQRTPAKIAAYYDLENGRGFCLVPEIARQQIWCYI